jgi:hypothetical protein
MFNAEMASPRALCRFDRCGDWCIAGRDGHIFGDGKAYLIVVMTGESVRRWNNVKKPSHCAGSVRMATTKNAFTLIGHRLPMKPT